MHLWPSYTARPRRGPRDRSVGSAGRRDAVHGTPHVRVRPTRLQTVARGSGVRTAVSVARGRPSLDVTQARESARPLIDGHDTVQPHARCRGHRLRARRRLRGVVVCVEIRFTAMEVDDGFNYAQDNSLSGRGAPFAKKRRTPSRRRASSSKTSK